MTQFSQEWFMEMASKIKARDHALEMVKRWQQKATDAETAIAELSTSMPTEVTHAQETEPASVQE